MEMNGTKIWREGLTLTKKRIRTGFREGSALGITNIEVITQSFISLGCLDYKVDNGHCDNQLY